MDTRRPRSAVCLWRRPVCRRTERQRNGQGWRRCTAHTQRKIANSRISVPRQRRVPFEGRRLKLGEHIPTILSGLAASWDDETARSLLFDDLCHQEGCFGATYAAIAHLLRIAEPEENRRQRWEIAFFVGFVAVCARNQDPHIRPGELQGLPETLEGWSGKH